MSADHVIVSSTMDSEDAARALASGAISYDVPEIIITPIIGGSTEYLSWVVAQTRA